MYLKKRCSDELVQSRSKFVFFTVLLSLFTNVISGASTNAAIDKDIEHNERIIESVLLALGKAVDFFAEHYEKLNLDAVIGTRIVEGQLQVLQNHVISSRKYVVSPIILQSIADIKDISGLVSDLATPHIQQKAPGYYHKVGNTLAQHFWELDYPSRDVNRSLIRQPLYDGESMHEEDSDDCLAELFGTGNSSKKCDISDGCWELMTSPGYQGYSLSHQIFYLEIGQQYGCESAIKQKILYYKQESLNSLHDELCANMLANSEEIAESGYPKDKQDLFMEQAALCGMLGYRQFTRFEWLERILSWQREPGCYGEVEEYKRYRHVAGPNAFKRSDMHGERNKREEKTMDDDCLAHATTVAISALAQYVRYISEYVSVERHVEDIGFA